MVAQALRGFGPPVTLLRLESDRTLGAVLAAATAAATGPLLAKMDDDDVYGPEHLWDLVLAHDYSRAVLVGKFPATVYLARSDRTLRQRRVPGETWSQAITGGTMLLARADLERAGGWRPMRRHVDRALVEDVLRVGAPCTGPMRPGTCWCAMPRATPGSATTPTSWVAPHPCIRGGSPRWQASGTCRRRSAEQTPEDGRPASTVALPQQAHDRRQRHQPGLRCRGLAGVQAPWRGSAPRIPARTPSKAGAPPRLPLVAPIDQGSVHPLVFEKSRAARRPWPAPQGSRIRMTLPVEVRAHSR